MSLATRVIAAAGAPMPPPRFVGRPLPPETDAEEAAEARLQRCSCCLLYRMPGQSPCGNCPRVTTSGRRSPAR